jgi:hypothetical protein
MAQEKEAKQPKEDWSQAPEEHFSDVFWLALNPWSAAITFGLRMARSQEKDTPKIRMRMPLQQAKALAVMLLQAIREYERKGNVNIELPANMLKSLNIAPEDWQRFTG